MRLKIEYSVTRKAVTMRFHFRWFIFGGTGEMYLDGDDVEELENVIKVYRTQQVSNE